MILLLEHPEQVEDVLSAGKAQATAAKKVRNAPGHFPFVLTAVNNRVALPVASPLAQAQSGQVGAGVDDRVASCDQRQQPSTGDGGRLAIVVDQQPRAAAAGGHRRCRPGSVRPRRRPVAGVVGVATGLCSPRRRGHLGR